MNWLFDFWSCSVLEASDNTIEVSLGFWREQEAAISTYEIHWLATLVHDYALAPASQTDVERVFSACGDLCCRKRHKATVPGLENLAFVKARKPPVEAALVVTYLQFPIQVCFPCISVCRSRPASHAHFHHVTDTFLNSLVVLIIVMMNHELLCCNQ